MDFFEESQPSGDTTENKPIRLCSAVMESFRVAKKFRDHQARINHMDYDCTGDRIVTSGDDDQIVLYDCMNGTKVKQIYSKKYGCGHVRFTHSPNCVIHASTKVDDTIRYLSLHDNKYLNYFSGHTKRITSLSMSPSSDMFMSTSEDGDLRMWDLGLRTSIGSICLPKLPTQSAPVLPVSTFDHEGIVFAVGMIGLEGKIKLYDARNYSQGPFLSFEIGLCDQDYEWTSLKFSPNGKLIMTCNSASDLMIFDSFNGEKLHRFLNAQGLTVGGKPNRNMDASFSPDSQFVMCGSPNGRVHVWDLKTTDTKLCTLPSEHPGPVDFVRFNPKYMMLATACLEMAFWVPPHPHNEDEQTTK